RYFWPAESIDPAERIRDLTGHFVNTLGETGSLECCRALTHPAFGHKLPEATFGDPIFERPEFGLQCRAAGFEQARRGNHEQSALNRTLAFLIAGLIVENRCRHGERRREHIRSPGCSAAEFAEDAILMPVVLTRSVDRVLHKPVGCADSIQHSPSERAVD